MWSHLHESENCRHKNFIQLFRIREKILKNGVEKKKKAGRKFLRYFLLSCIKFFLRTRNYSDSTPQNFHKPPQRLLSLSGIGMAFSIILFSFFRLPFLMAFVLKGRWFSVWLQFVYIWLLLCRWGLFFMIMIFCVAQNLSNICEYLLPRYYPVQNFNLQKSNYSLVEICERV